MFAAKENQMEPSIIAIDLAKRVFQIHYVDPQTGAIHSKALKRAQLVAFFANRPACRVFMEACAALIIGPELWHDSATTCGL
jgi:transposase